MTGTRGVCLTHGGETLASAQAGLVWLILVAAALLAWSADAQQYGQWSWTGSLGVGSRGVTSRSGGVTTEDWRVDELQVFAGLNGFVLHPAICAFEIGGDFSLQSETEGVDVDRNGYRGRLRVLSQSAVPVEIYASSASFGYGHDGEETEAPLFRRGVPDSVTTLGGTVRVRRGVLAGLLAGFETSSTEFVESTPRGGDSWERTYANWSGETRGIRHMVLVDQRSTTYGDLDYRYDELSLTIDERSGTEGDWSWNAIGSGFVRDYAYESGTTGSTTLLRLIASASRRYSSSRYLTLRYDGGSSSAGEADSALTQRLFGDFRFPAGERWTFAPYAGVNYASTEDARATIPQIGVAGAWRRTLGSFVVDANGSMGVLVFDESFTSNGETLDAEGNEFAGSIGIVVSKAGLHGLSQRFEVAGARNEFNAAGESIAGLPDFGVGITRPGFQDSARARYSLSKTFGSRRASTWAEWGARRFEREAVEVNEAVDSGTIEDFRVSIQLSSTRTQLLINGGSTTIDETRGAQNVDFYSGSLSVRATGRVSITASMFHSDQNVDLAPDIRLERLDAGVEFEAGLLRVGARAFFTEEERVAGIELDSSGVEFHVRRSFGGYLPIVSAPVRRGVVK